MTPDTMLATLCSDLAARDPSGVAPTIERATELARRLLPLGTEVDVGTLAEAAFAHVCGLGPLQRFLADPGVNEVMVNNGGDVWIERDGAIVRAGRLEADVTPRVIERILSPLGRRLDRLSPIVDARLPDGSRVCAVIPPVAVDGPCLTLRRFGVRRRTLDEFGDPHVVGLLAGIVLTRCNVLISGATRPLVSHGVGGYAWIACQLTVQPSTPASPSRRRNRSASSARSRRARSTPSPEAGR